MWRRVYLPLALEVAGLTALGAALVALVVLLVAGPHAEMLLLIVPAGAGAVRWLGTFSEPKVAPLRRRALLDAAIDLAPHRFERAAHPTHRLYGTFVEADGELVAVALVYREPGAREVTIIERRHHRGEELEEAAAAVAAVDARAAELERQVRDRQQAERQVAEDERRRQLAEAEDARLRAIDDHHRRELAEREAELRTEDERLRRDEAQREAESLARALRREP